MMEIEEEVEARLQDLQLQLRSQLTEVDDEPASKSDEEDDDDDDTDDEEDDPCRVQVGYVQKPDEPWILARHHFPSKAGGTPAWLDPVKIPEGKELTICGVCKTPLEFLMQVYAPMTESDDTFHRTLFVFVCPSMECLKASQTEQNQHASEITRRSVRVFRSQLPRANAYYSVSAPRSDGQDKPTCDGVALCSWCGTWKGKLCSGCKQAFYCTQVHQRLHWAAGHSTFCREVRAREKPRKVDTPDTEGKEEQGDRKVEAPSTATPDGTTSGDNKEGIQDYSAGIAFAANKKVCPEFEIVVDVEPREQVLGDGDGAAQSREKSLYLEYMRKVGEGLSVSDVRGVTQVPKDQLHWAAFQARLARAPEQVLRYCRSPGAKPLWPRLDDQPLDADIRPCRCCGGPRIFEFQILPQLLYFLGVENEPNSLDWGTIAVYSCAASCQIRSGSGAGRGYQEELAWVQLA